MNDGEENPRETAAFCAKLEELLPSYDLVIVADYGHGLLSPKAIGLLCNQARFLAVNTQINAGNRGFNAISKYPRAGFVCISENEMRLEARSLRRDIKEIVKDVSEALSCDRILVTRGQDGCLCYGKDESFAYVPAIAHEVVDRMGAGDTVLAVAALCWVGRTALSVETNTNVSNLYSNAAFASMCVPPTLRTAFVGARSMNDTCWWAAA